jgi:hypothetical protein
MKSCIRPCIRLCIEGYMKVYKITFLVPAHLVRSRFGNYPLRKRRVASHLFCIEKSAGTGVRPSLKAVYGNIARPLIDF